MDFWQKTVILLAFVSIVAIVAFFLAGLLAWWVALVLIASVSWLTLTAVRLGK